MALQCVAAAAIKELIAKFGNGFNFVNRMFHKDRKYLLCFFSVCEGAIVCVIQPRFHLRGDKNRGREINLSLHTRTKSPTSLCVGKI